MCLDRDRALLLQSVLPVLEGALMFFLDYMTMQDDKLGAEADAFAVVTAYGYFMLTRSNTRKLLVGARVAHSSLPPGTSRMMDAICAQVRVYRVVSEVVAKVWPSPNQRELRCARLAPLALTPDHRLSRSVRCCRSQETVSACSRVQAPRQRTASLLWRIVDWTSPVVPPALPPASPPRRCWTAK